MAINQNLTEALQAVRNNLSDLSLINEPDNYSKLTGTLNYLFSPENPRQIQATMLREGQQSKYRNVEIQYNTYKGDDNVVTSDAAANCNAVAARRTKVQTLSPTLYVEDKFTISDAIIREGNTELIAQQLTREIRDSQRNNREKINAALLAKLANNMGTNPAQNAAAGAYTAIQLINADGTVNSDKFDTIVNDVEDNFMQGSVGLIGLGKARKYMNRLTVGNINDGGVDVREIMANFGMALFKDQFARTTLGNADNILALYPGLQSFFNYNLFAGDDFMKETPDLSRRMTIPDALYPFEYDFILKYDDGCATGNGLQGAWTGRLLTYFDTWIVPSNAFGSEYGDLAGFNGITGYQITQA
jgi:hypothetical protein